MGIEDEVYSADFGGNDDFDRELDQDLIEDLALDYIWGEITDDNPSAINGLSGLEQIIAYVFNYSQDDKKAIRKIKYRVYAKITELNGGCDMSGSDFLSFP